jgi:phosphonate transport system substrate-binding protein
VYAARRELDPALVERIKQALLALSMNNPEHQPILKKAGFIAVIPAQDRDFNAVRRLAEIVEAGGRLQKSN